MEKAVTHGSLFSGIGGFDLAAQWMGWENAFHCEINPFCKRVLKYYWPNATKYSNIKKTDFSIWRGKINVLSGGFPCQPYSTAGKRLGKEDERHLWPEMLRAIREIKPQWVVGENVLGLLNWNGGLVFNEVQADLENQGYEVQAFILPACGKDAPHKRDRIWFVAYSDQNYNRRTSGENEGKSKKERISKRNKVQLVTKSTEVFEESYSDPTRFRKQKPGGAEHPLKSTTKENWKASWSFLDGRWPTESPFCSRNDGLSERLVDITIRKWREEALMGLGNAIVPQIALEIFTAIEAYENYVSLNHG